MSNQGLNTKQTTPKLENLELQGLVTLHIPDDVKNKIKFLCKKIAKDEWSGVLFYTLKGSIRNADKMEITLKDILLMDRGTSVYTSFDWDEDIVNYRMDNPDAMDWIVGHIHSHNTMRVFFSGTDWSELNDNCPQHNFYLSVIVNNYLDVVAKIAFTAQPQTFTCKDENGKDYSLKLTGSDLNPIMFVYDCNIKMKEEKILVPNDFSERINSVELKAKKRREEEEAKRVKTQVNNPVIKDKQLDLYNKSRVPDFDPKNKAHNNSVGDFMDSNLFLNNEDDDFSIQSIEQEFATYVLRLGNNEDVIDDELIDALEDIEEEINKNKLFPDSFADSVIQSYGALYDRFFEKISKYHGDEPFLAMLELVIAEFQSLEEDYKFLTPLISALQSMGYKFENFIKENQTV